MAVPTKQKMKMSVGIPKKLLWDFRQELANYPASIVLNGTPTVVDQDATGFLTIGVPQVNSTLVEFRQSGRYVDIGHAVIVSVEASQIGEYTLEVWCATTDDVEEVKRETTLIVQ